MEEPHALRGEVQEPLKLPHELDSITRIETIGNTTSSLPKLMQNFLKTFSSEQAKLEQGEITEQQFQRHSIVLIGPPGVGKSYVRGYLEKWIRGKFPQFSQEGLINDVTWERDGLGSDRPLGRPFSEQESMLANRNFANNLASKLNSSIIVTVECPALATLTKRDKKWIGRPTGSLALRAAEMKSNIFFTKEEKESSEYDVEMFPPNKQYYISILGGPLLRRMMVYLRDDLRNVASLKEAQKICALYGKPIPRNAQELRSLSQDGASVEQIEYLEALVRLAIEQLKTEDELGNSIVPLDFDNFSKGFEDDAMRLQQVLPESTEQILKEMYESYAVASFLKHVTQKTLKILPSQLLIAYNNPSLEDLNISPDLYDELKDHLKRIYKRNINP
jgi:hypothetical protein